MLLLEEVEAVTADTATCRVAVSPGSVLAPFLDTNGDLPGWFALELMAQTVGVWSGWHRQQQGTNIARFRHGAGRARTGLRGPAGRKDAVHQREAL